MKKQAIALAMAALMAASMTACSGVSDHSYQHSLPVA